MITVKFEGAKELEQLLNKFKDPGKVISPYMKAAAKHVEGKIAKYPPATDGNVPITSFVSGARHTWYERNYGPKWIVASGEIHSRKRSEMLGKKWTIQIRDGGMTAVVGNNTSYAPYVQDKEKQTWFHEAHGWKTAQDVAQEEASTVEKLILDGLKAVIARG